MSYDESDSVEITSIRWNVAHILRGRVFVWMYVLIKRCRSFIFMVGHVPFLMAFATLPPSVNSISSFSDSASDVATLDMYDNLIKPALDDKEVFEFGTSPPVFEKEGSLNSSMITVIVSLRGALAAHHLTDILVYRSTTSTFASILTSSKENRRH